MYMCSTYIHMYVALQGFSLHAWYYYLYRVVFLFNNLFAFVYRFVYRRRIVVRKYSCCTIHFVQTLTFRMK